MGNREDQEPENISSCMGTVCVTLSKSAGFKSTAPMYKQLHCYVNVAFYCRKNGGVFLFEFANCTSSEEGG